MRRRARAVLCFALAAASLVGGAVGAARPVAFAQEAESAHIRMHSFVDGASGSLSVEPDARGGRVLLKASGLPRPQSLDTNARTFQVWAVGEGITARVAELRTDGLGGGAAQFGCPVAFDRFGVIVSAEENSYVPRPGKVVLSTADDEVTVLFGPESEAGASNATQAANVKSASPETNISGATQVARLEAVVPAGAQQQRARRESLPRREDDADEEVVRVDTDLVLVDVTVTDSAGKPVRGLRAEDFKLYEDGVERPISFFNVERRGGEPRPVAVVFAVDVSGSMSAEEMLRLSGALRAFAAQLEGRQSVFAVVSFGMNVKVQQQFTSDPRKLQRAVEELARDVNGLSTHAYDAVDDAIRLLVRKAPRTRERRLMRRAVVVVTDGFPVGDTVSPRTVIERANAADVGVYTVTLPSYSRLLASVADARRPLPTPLDVSGLVEKTGGTGVYATDKDFTPLFKALAEEVTSSYVLAFYPPEEKRRDGRTHTVRVEAPRGLQVRQSRTSYKSSDK